MTSGLEIFDINNWENPVRLSQLRTKSAVTGVAVAGNLAYLASGAEGLLVVDVTDPSQPLLLNSFPVPGYRATDLDINSTNNILALSAADDLGGGFVKFFDLHDDELSPPEGYSPIAFADELQGQPLDVQWLNGKLYVLLKRSEQLYLVILINYLTKPVTKFRH